MTREEFLTEFTISLKKNNIQDIRKTVKYFEEIIDDKIENGMSEEEAVNSLGSIDEIILNLEEETSPKKGASLSNKILLILGFPIWGTIVACFFVIALLAYIVIGTVLLCLWVIYAGVCAYSLYSLVLFFINVIQTPESAILSLSAFLMLSGGAIMLIKPLLVLTKLIFRTSLLLFDKIKLAFKLAFSKLFNYWGE